MNFLKSQFKQIIAGMIIIVLPLCIYLFSHSNPERLIRDDLFCKDNFISAFTTDVYKGNVVSKPVDFNKVETYNLNIISNKDIKDINSFMKKLNLKRS